MFRIFLLQRKYYYPSPPLQSYFLIRRQFLLVFFVFQPTYGGWFNGGGWVTGVSNTLPLYFFLDLKILGRSRCSGSRPRRKTFAANNNNVCTSCQPPSPVSCRRHIDRTLHGDCMRRVVRSRPLFRVRLTTPAVAIDSASLTADDGVSRYRPRPSEMPTTTHPGRRRGVDATLNSIVFLQWDICTIVPS